MATIFIFYDGRKIWKYIPNYSDSLLSQGINFNFRFSIFFVRSEFRFSKSSPRMRAFFSCPCKHLAHFSKENLTDGSFFFFFKAVGLCNGRGDWVGAVLTREQILFIYPFPWIHKITKMITSMITYHWSIINYIYISHNIIPISTVKTDPIYCKAIWIVGRFVVQYILVLPFIYNIIIFKRLMKNRIKKFPALFSNKYSCGVAIHKKNPQGWGNLNGVTHCPPLVVSTA